MIGSRSSGSWWFAVRIAGCAMCTMPLASIAVLALPAGHAVEAVVRWWCRVIVRLTGCAVTVFGREHLVAGSIIVANHRSYIDSIVLLATLPTGVRFVVHREAVGWPMVGRAVRKSGHIVVDRNSPRSRFASFLAMKESLDQGCTLVVFPEGRRGGGALLPFKTGPFRAAAEARRSIVPIALVGTQEILPRRLQLPRRAPIEVHIRPAVRPENESRDAVRQLRDAAAASISACLEATEL